jgi:L-threonylcarbamoyladenylate synthase
VYWNISATTPDPATLHAVVQVIRNGGIIAFPTSTLYGLGADANNPQAVERIFDIKGRQFHRPLLVLIRDRTFLPELVREIPPKAVLLMEAFWPGGVTVVFHAGEWISSRLTGNTGKIGVRVPKHPVAAAIVAQLEGPMTGTSANLSGRGGCSDIACLEKQISAQLDGVADAGPLQGGRGSTVIDVTIDPPQILREGTISEHQIQSVLSNIV